MQTWNHPQTMSTCTDINDSVWYRTKPSSNSLGCLIRPLKTSGYRPQHTQIGEIRKIILCRFNVTNRTKKSVYGAEPASKQLFGRCSVCTMITCTDIYSVCRMVTCIDWQVMITCNICCVHSIDVVCLQWLCDLTGNDYVWYVVCAPCLCSVCTMIACTDM